MPVGDGIPRGTNPVFEARPANALVPPPVPRGQLPPCDALGCTFAICKDAQVGADGDLLPPDADGAYVVHRATDLTVTQFPIPLAVLADARVDIWPSIRDGILRLHGTTAEDCPPVYDEEEEQARAARIERFTQRRLAALRAGKEAADA